MTIESGGNIPPKPKSEMNELEKLALKKKKKGATAKGQTVSPSPSQSTVSNPSKYSSPAPAASGPRLVKKSADKTDSPSPATDKSLKTSVAVPQQPSAPPPPPVAPPPPPVAPPPPPPPTPAEKAFNEIMEGRSRNVKAPINPDKSKLLSEIQKGVHLNNVASTSSHKFQGLAPKEEVEKSRYLSAEGYLYSGVFDYFKDQLTKKMIETKGVPGKSKEINELLKGHAAFSGKDKEHEAVKGEVNSTENRKLVKVNAYAAYFHGRDKKLNINNTYFDTLESFLDKKLSDLAREAKQEGCSLRDKMQSKYKISPSVKSPSAFFTEFPELVELLKKLEIEVQWIRSTDLTVEFIDALIVSETDPDRIEPFADAIFDREYKTCDSKKSRIETSKTKLKARAGRKGATGQN